MVTPAGPHLLLQEARQQRPLRILRMDRSNTLPSLFPSSCRCGPFIKGSSSNSESPQYESSLMLYGRLYYHETSPGVHSQNVSPTLSGRSEVFTRRWSNPAINIFMLKMVHFFQIIHSLVTEDDNSLQNGRTSHCLKI